jgi:hypothetical protein
MLHHIKRILVGALLLLVASAAFAQAPSCWPSNVGGTGTRYYGKLIDSPAGHPDIDPVWAVWWHCPDATQASGWQTPHLMCAEQNLPTCLATPIVATVSGAAAAWAAAAPSAPSSIGLGWAEAVLFSQYVPPTVPPKPTWTVAPNGTRTTRAAFAVTNGVRALSSTSKATVGAPCDCAAIKLIEGKITYCQVAPATVSACVSSPTP